MNRAQIRRAFIEAGHKNTTDAQIRAAISSLNLPSEDGYDYNPDQLYQIQEYMLKPKQNQPEPTTDRAQYQTGEASQLATTTAQAIRGQVSQMHSLIEQVGQQQDLLTDHLSDQFVEMIDPGNFWKTLGTKVKAKLEGRPQASPFVMEPIELPTMPDAAARYLESSRQQYSLPPSESQPALVGASDSQHQQLQSNPASSNGHRKTAELPSVPSNGKSDPRKAASPGFGRTQGK